MKTVLTDAYSPSNLGDGELVARTIEMCLKMYPGDVSVVCTDREGFTALSSGDVKFVDQPLDRVKSKSRNRAVQILAGLSDLSILGLAILISGLPLPHKLRRMSLVMFAKLTGAIWLSEIASSNNVIAVGGGYLGDKYIKQSIVRLGVYRIATAVGAGVETMPISISSCNSRFLGTALRLLASQVSWRARESTTFEILSKLSLTVELVPDLAWLNALDDGGGGKSDSKEVTICPLGSDFYTEAGPGVFESIVQTCKSDSIETISLVAMHSWDNRLKDGKDDVACVRLVEKLTEIFPGKKVQHLVFTEYSQVVNQMNQSALAICQRLHGAIAAASAGTPVMVHAYEPKHIGVFSLATLDALVVQGADGGWTPIDGEEIKMRAKSQAEAVLVSLLGEC